MTARNKTPEQLYREKVRMATYKGVLWELTFDQFWELWAPYWEHRDLYRLCRKIPRNGWTMENVEIR